MFNMILLVLMFMFMCGSFSFILKRKHLLSMLLSLEYVVLSLFFMLLVMLMIYKWELYFLMIFLTFSVCEGVLGLAIMVSMIRTHGNDYFQSYSIMQC
uniref:NADH-ubiquinone oxidoreductase chain 4L n=1 Tax=Myiodactylus osmyloides TaxID=560910 RepID=A0A1S5QYR8_9NEOP|nr:NADH dehydrogenase subunit 4L [Myiodactylus osmyloides]